MELDHISVVVRPRNPWEAIDLGIVMARAWWKPLALAWLALSLPLFILLQTALFDYPTLVIVVMWWLKPIWERPLLYLSSHALFGEMPTLRQALKAAPGLAARQWFASLTYRRFSFTRSMDLPVIQLENLKGQDRSKRIWVLHRTTNNGATWLTLLGAHIESLLYIGLFALIYLLVPEQITVDWGAFFFGEESGVNAIRNIIAYMCMMAVAPFYVTCGFSLYLNRRTLLEAWDIEIAFRRLRRRAQGLRAVASLALWLVCSVLLVDMPLNQVQAAVQEDEPAIAQTVEQDVLTERDQVRTVIQEIMSRDEFHNRETIRRPKWFKEWWDSQEEDDEQKISGPQWLVELVLLIARSAEFILWGAVVLLIVYFAHKYRHWLGKFLYRYRPPPSEDYTPPGTLFGMALGQDTLPQDVMSAVQELWQQQQQREAFSLLYRATLIHLMERYGVRFHESYTEGECVQSVRVHTPEKLSRYFSALTRQWQYTAYAHRIPEQANFERLCSHWPEFFQETASDG